MLILLIFKHISTYNRNCLTLKNQLNFSNIFQYVQIFHIIENIMKSIKSIVRDYLQNILSYNYISQWIIISEYNFIRKILDISQLMIKCCYVLLGFFYYFQWGKRDFISTKFEMNKFDLQSNNSYSFIYSCIEVKKKYDMELRQKYFFKYRFEQFHTSDFIFYTSQTIN